MLVCHHGLEGFAGVRKQRSTAAGPTGLLERSGSALLAQAEGAARSGCQECALQGVMQGVIGISGAVRTCVKTRVQRGAVQIVIGDMGNGQNGPMTGVRAQTDRTGGQVAGEVVTRGRRACQMRGRACGGGGVEGLLKGWLFASRQGRRAAWPWLAQSQALPPL